MNTTTDTITAPAQAMALVPQVPAALPPEAVSDIQSKALTISNEFETKSQDREFMNGLMNLGSEAQQNASRKLELLKGKVGTLLNDLDGEGAKIPKDLVDLRMMLDKINPHKIEKKGFFSKLLGKVPGVGDRLKEIAVRYESVQTQIDIIVNNIREGRDTLIRDNISLEQLYDDVKFQQVAVQKNAYLGELLIAELEKRVAAAADPVLKQKLEMALHSIAMRVQDLRTMEQVNMQFFVSIDLTTNNNHLLAQAVDRTLTVTTNVITVGLAIAAALANQKRTMEATKATQEYAGNILASNAAAIRQQTTEIAQMYNSPVLALEKVQKSYDDLMAAMDEVEKVKRQGIETAKKGMAQLSDMSQSLSKKAGLTSGAQADVPKISSIEA
ncbi:MAG: toxic anion resistance protein [Desulfobacteraceae bacterium]|jgi:uncharacterized protein YaaN involved in tellurite resistance